MGVLLENTGVCCELNIHYPDLKERLNEQVNKIQFNQEDKGIQYAPFTMNIASSTRTVMEKASNRMKQFNQILLSEGHLADAIIKSNVPAKLEVLDELDCLRILDIMASPRDMIVSLKNYSSPVNRTNHLTYRKAVQSDAIPLKNIVEKEFGKRWLDSINNGFSAADIPIYIALADNDIVGFACFDVVRCKKGLFGPMGTISSNRVKGVGYNLLHLCLSNMKEIGYEYAIIGQAGPIEFYEKACNAIVIPKFMINHVS